MTAYMHFKIKENRVTAAIKVKDDVAHVALAFCCPRDQFSKKLGRIIAEGRLAHKGPHFTWPVSPDRRTKEQVHEFILAAVEAGSETFPAAWAQE